MRLTKLYALLVFTLSLIGLLLLVSPLLTTRQAQLRHAAAAYNEALFSTQAQLVNLLRLIPDNGVLQQNLNWELNHSVEKALEVTLRSGELDEVMLVDASCNVFAKTAVGESVIRDCPLTNLNGSTQEQFFWLRAGGFPSLGIILPIQTETRGALFIAGYVHLRPSWFDLHPQLKDLRSSLNLELVEEAKAGSAMILAREGLTAKGKAVATLVATDNLARWLPALRHAKAPTNSLLWLLLGAAGLLLGLAWWRSDRDALLQHSEKADGLRAIKSLVGSGPGDKGDLPTATFKDVTAQVAAVLQASQDKVRDLKKEVVSLKQGLLDKETELASKAQRIDGMAGYESLVDQLQKDSVRFSSQMQNLQSQTEDVADILVHGVSRSAQALNAVIAEWRKEVGERGARRFFRSLTEMPGRAHESYLDDQMQTLFALSDELATQSVNASIHTQKLTSAIKETRSLSEHWLDLTAADGAASKPVVSMLDAVLEAQRLLNRPGDGKEPVQFSNPFELSSIKHLPRIPKAALVSAVYHLYSALAFRTGAAATDFCIQHQFKTSENRLSLVVSLDSEVSADLNVEQQHHLDLAVRLLTKHGLSCQKLPGLSANSVFAITWEKPIGKPASGRSRAATY